MNTMKATWKNGRVVLDGDAGWPDGRRLIVMEDQSVDIRFMTEDEQSDDPASIQRWIDDLRALPAIPEDDQKESERRTWQETMKKLNVEAVRQQMEKGIG